MAASVLNDFFTTEQLQELRERYVTFLDIDETKPIEIQRLFTADTFSEALKALGEHTGANRLSDFTARQEDGSISYDEFMEVLGLIGKTEFDQLGDQEGLGGDTGSVVDVSQSASHNLFRVVFPKEEMSVFAKYLNEAFKDEEHVADLLPMAPQSGDLFSTVRDGRLLSYLINKAVEHTVDTRALNKGENLPLTKIYENQMLMLSSARSIGVQVLGDAAEHMLNGEEHPHAVLGIIWQLVKLEVQSNMNLNEHPEILRLSSSEEEASDINRLTTGDILLRWVNHHLRPANCFVSKFGSLNPKFFLHILHALRAAESKTDTPEDDIADIEELSNERAADLCIKLASELGANLPFDASELSSCNRRTNELFASVLFRDLGSGLQPLTEEEELKVVGVSEADFLDVGTSREERAFRMWINTLGVVDTHITSLGDDCSDGLVLLKMIDYIEPGIVEWKKVETRATNRFKKVANCNYVIVLGREMGFSLVGIGGVDILDRKEKLVVAFVWQLMRYHAVKFLESLTVGKHRVTEAEIISWCNEKVATKSTRRMKNFNDSTLADSLYFIDLLAAVDPRIVDWKLVTPGRTNEEQMLNARYAISIARKLGATLFLLPEDVIECKPKMIMTFCAAIMTIELQRQQH